MAYCNEFNEVALHEDADYDDAPIVWDEQKLNVCNSHTFVNFIA